MRQLSIGLSAYRLFPGRLEQPAFVAATERISQAATRALELGPIDAEVRGDGFHIEDGPLDLDEAILRLARACYERRAERIRRLDRACSDCRSSGSRFPMNWYSWCTARTGPACRAGVASSPAARPL